MPPTSSSATMAIAAQAPGGKLTRVGWLVVSVGLGIRGPLPSEVASEPLPRAGGPRGVPPTPRRAGGGPHPPAAHTGFGDALVSRRYTVRRAHAAPAAR